MSLADHDASPVLVERDGAVLTITLNRPEARNAINSEIAHAVAAAIDTLEQDPELSVGILTAVGEVFCAGMDLKAFLRGERPRTEQRGFGGLVEAPPTKPLIVAVNGPALAGGCELVLAADIVIASTTATFGLPEVKRGLVAAGGGLARLPRILPKPLAMEMILTGDAVTAEELRATGMINRIVVPDRVLDTARDMARRIAANGPLAIVASKRIVEESRDWESSEIFERTREISGPVFDSADAKEGAVAFAERRAPAWTAS